MSSSLDPDYQRIHGKGIQSEKHLPAVVGGFCFDSEAQPYKYESQRTMFGQHFAVLI